MRTAPTTLITTALLLTSSLAIAGSDPLVEMCGSVADAAKEAVVRHIGSSDTEMSAFNSRLRGVRELVNQRYLNGDKQGAKDLEIVVFGSEIGMEMLELSGGGNRAPSDLVDRVWIRVYSMCRGFQSIFNQ